LPNQLLPQSSLSPASATARVIGSCSVLAVDRTLLVEQLAVERHA
jgi:hypothetical protein